MNCELILESHINEGRISIGSAEELIKKQKYHIKINIKENEEKNIISLSKLPPGLKKGLEIISFKIDNVDLLLLNHLETKDFCYFEMKGNPYVDNIAIAETMIVFNGNLIIKLNLRKILWFPTYYSKKQQDFVFDNNHETCTNADGCYHGEINPHDGRWLNIPYSQKIDLKNKKIALGCSVTYGTGISKLKTWPALLGFSNYGVPGAGVDSIYFNLVSLSAVSTIKSVIILLPDLSRRLITFKKKNYYFRIPFTINTNISDQFKNDYFWLNQKKYQELKDEIISSMVKDRTSEYSKKYLEKLSLLPHDIKVSSWSRETYDLLTKYFQNILPFFEKIDHANDDQNNIPHPGSLSHYQWVEKIKNNNI